MNDKDIIKELFKPQMAEYLCDKELSAKAMTQIISGAPISLTRKVEMLESYYAQMWHPFVKQYLTLAKQGIEALTLKKGEIFVLVGRGGDNVGYELFECMPCNSLQKALEYLKNEGIDYSNVWYDLEKWSLDQEGNYNEVYRYEIINGEICFFEHDCNNTYKEINFKRNPNLNLPIVFNVGDIVTIDASPYARQTHVVIIEKGDNSDCCCVSGLHLTADGFVDVGAIKHGSVGSSLVYNAASCLPEKEGFTATISHTYNNAYSPLYRLEKFKGKLSNGERILGEIAKLCTDESTGNKLYKFIKQERRTPEEALSFLESLKNLDKLKE